MSITWSGAPLLLRIGMTATAHTSAHQIESIKQILDTRFGQDVAPLSSNAECCHPMAELMEWSPKANGRWPTAIGL